MFNFTREEREREFAHKFADDIKKRLLGTTILGLLTVVSTGVSAAFGYYTRDLPKSIDSLTSSVLELKALIKEQQSTNDRQDDDTNGLEVRVTRLENERR